MRVGARITRFRRAALGAALVVVGLVAAGSTSPPADADGGPNGRGMAGWVPYWETTRGTAALIANADLFEEVSPFWYAAQGGPADIVLKSTVAQLNTVVSAARQRGVPVVPTITDGNPPLVTAGYLADPASRTQHADALVDLVVANGFDGIDIDYEGFAFHDGRASWPALQPNWVAFVQELGSKLHGQGKRLAVTVPPIWFTAAGTPHTGSYWVYDWVSIGPSVDRLRVMTYDWSVGSAGPISPIAFVEGTIDYAQSIGFDMTKLQIGIPLYGRNWVTKTDGICPPGTSLGTRSVANRQIDALIAGTGGSPVRDAVSGEMRFTYQESSIGDGTADPGVPTPGGPNPDLGGIGTATASAGAVRLGACTITRTVWYLDEYAIAVRAKAATDAGAGVAVWALGFDTGWTWSALRSQLAPQR